MIYEACQSSLGIKWYALILSERYGFNSTKVSHAAKYDIDCGSVLRNE